MSRQAIENEIKAIVSEVTGIAQDKLPSRANFIDDLGIESVMALDIVGAVEKQFGIDIPVDKFGDIDSVEAMAGVIYELKEGSAV